MLKYKQEDFAGKFFYFYGKGVIAKKPITWGMKREVRKYYFGSRSELTGEWGVVVMHHSYDSRRSPLRGFTGRPYSIFDGQLRNPKEEILMHFRFSAGNSERSWAIQEANNQKLFEGLWHDWCSGRELPFPPEVMKAIPGWLEQFPEWLAEFRAAKETARQYKIAALQRKRVLRKCFPRASLNKRQIKKLWNQPSSAVLQAIA